MEGTLKLIDTCIQYGVLGVLGWIAIRTFVKQFNNSNDLMKKLLEHLVDCKDDGNSAVMESLSLIIQTMNKNQENLIRFKYEIMTELQTINNLIRNLDGSEEQQEKLDEIMNSLEEIKFEIIPLPDLKKKESSDSEK